MTGALLDALLVIAEYSEPAYLEGITDRPLPDVFLHLVVLPSSSWVAGVIVGAGMRNLIPSKKEIRLMAKRFFRFARPS